MEAVDSWLLESWNGTDREDFFVKRRVSVSDECPDDEECLIVCIG